MVKQKLSSLSVGSTIKLNVDGSPKAFIVVHQGKPSDLYDDSCNGTWLLMKDCYENRQWHSSNSNSYKASTIHSYLNSTFLGLFESNIQEAIKQVKIPYVNGTGSSAVASGANGLSAKIFLLSGYEVGFTTSDNSYFPVDGAKLSYFESGTGSSALNKRIANYNGSATNWWLRSPVTVDAGSVWLVFTVGNSNDNYASGSRGIRPALILDSNYEMDMPYNLTTTTPSKIQTGDILDCPYSGVVQSITLPKGTYKLECWGAQGGTYSSYKGGPGGYSVGTITLTDKKTVYLYSGGAGTISTTAGFNGGGTGIKNGHGGGGASDIRIGTDSLYARVIVAGGGGGAGVTSANANPSGCGGGLYGGDGYYNNTTGSYTTGSNRCGGSASQTAGGKSWSTQSAGTGTFGQGGNASGYSCGGGGGGWYGGGGAYDNDSDADGRWGGGGSGYVYTSSTASNYPTGCLLTSDYYLTDASTVAGNTSFTSPTGTAETGHSGDGYVRITVIEAKSGNTLIKTDSTTWKNYKNMFVKTDWKSTLPSGYTQLEYIQSSGTQYIDTGFLPTIKTRVVMDIEPLEISSIPAFFGTRNSSSPTASLSYSVWATSSTYIRSDYFGSSILSNETNILTRGTIDKNKNIMTGYNLTITNNETSEGACPYNLFLLACNDIGTAKYFLNGILYSCKMYNNDTLIRNFIPAKNSSSTLGLYDTVNSKFYTNAGTGTFIAGPEVSPWKSVKGLWVKTDSTTWKQAL